MSDIEYALSFCDAGRPRRVLHPGALLSQLLNDRRLSLTDFARHSGINISSIYALIDGRQGLTDAICGRLAFALDLPVEFWFLAQQRYRYQCYLDELWARLADAQATRSAA